MGLTGERGNVVFVGDDEKVFDANVEVDDVAGVKEAEELPQHDRTHLRPRKNRGKQIKTDDAISLSF